MGIDHRQESGPGPIIAPARADRLDAAARVLTALAACTLLAAVLTVGFDAWHRTRPVATAPARCLTATELVLAPAGTRGRHPQLLHPGVDLRYDPNLPPLPAGLLDPGLAGILPTARRPEPP